MKTLKHTPGPWGTDTEFKSTTSTIYVVGKAEKDGDWPVICRMTSEALFIRDPYEIKANAALIAAAPDLLDLARMIHREVPYLSEKTGAALDRILSQFGEYP